ncbi:hypothetical protein [Nocardioides sp. TF02-7]|uniref:glycoside hydrolase family 78 protein n=1 Tax=Nocardioides sp. TF02-7 TaxID=2917724 RepID=UPI001F06DFB1|nr:hypothetical protein [Nocardioides sp. TF02-7]UMG93984.1 hypothetical protein MF408_07850 [Nocardioides sp. TF02-7]
MTGDSDGANACYDASVPGACPLDEQTAYEIEAASSVDALEAGDLIWDSGRVRRSANQAELGVELDSRAAVVWRVRVWDATQQISAWSEPSTFTVGLLDQDDWGDAQWIDQPGRTEADPLPIFARAFEVPDGKGARRRAPLPLRGRPAPRDRER